MTKDAWQHIDNAAGPITPEPGPTAREWQDGWQPIETAPNDYSLKLAYGIWQGEIHGVSKHPAVDIITTRANRTDWGDGEGWWNCATGDAYACWMKPTYWMPLPPPPKTPL